MLAPTSSRSAAAAREERRTPLVPPQHGAWAFLALPLVLGSLVAPASWSTVWLAWAAFTLYPASWFAQTLVRARRPARFRRPLVLWLVAAAVPSGLLLATRPWLLWVGVGYAALFGVNLAFARRHLERDLVNDVVLAAQAVALVPLTWVVASPHTEIPERVWLLTVGCALALAGSTLHVKSLIRERRDPAYAAGSRTFAVLSVAVAAVLAWAWGLPGGAALLAPYVVLAGRAFWSGSSGWRPVRIGLVELAGFALVAAGAAVAALV